MFSGLSSGMALRNDETPEQRYAERIARFRSSAKVVHGRVRRLANARLLLFAATVVALVLTRRMPLVFWLIAAGATGFFVWLVIKQRAARERLRVLHARAELCTVGVSRCRREWDLIPVVLHDPAYGDHAYARDLDLFGRPALTQLFGPVHTVHGKRALREWLLHPADLATVYARQYAVRVLAANIDFREELAVAAQSSVGSGQERLDHFVDWVAQTRLPVPHPLAIWWARLIPAAIVVLIIAQATDAVARAWWLIPMGMSAIFSGFTLRRTYRTFDAAFSTDPAPLSYSAAFSVAERAPADGGLLQQIRDQLQAGGASAARRIKRLEQIMLYADVRHSGTASFLLELFFQWSFHVRLALQRWQEQSRADLGGWFTALGTLESLCALATMAHDQPDWCFPQLEGDRLRIEAEQLGHPMIRPAARVDNDVALGPPGSFLLVTGSNMSGKSTLLRGIGVNTVLALAGAPVCARSFRLPPLRLYTSINVRDSLAGGVSLYMAQLQRIKTIIDAAQQTSAELCCYLFDEILSGTNSTDRTTAVRAIVQHLLELPAIGGLATHDLALAQDERIRTAAHSIHFSETIDAASGRMTFDYKIRAGPVQSSNAIQLMHLMGIKLE